jgi:signal transduction histidine kinase
MSNAVKYSNKGVITVNVSKVTREINGEYLVPPPQPLDITVLKIKPLSTLTNSVSTRESSLSGFMARNVSKRYASLPPSQQSEIGMQDKSRETRSVRDAVHLRVEVEDKGIGLSDEARQTLFRFSHLMGII